jgi:hypothetical protein
MDKESEDAKVQVGAYLIMNFEHCFSSTWNFRMKGHRLVLNYSGGLNDLAHTLCRNFILQVNPCGTEGEIFHIIVVKDQLISSPHRSLLG